MKIQNNKCYINGILRQIYIEKGQTLPIISKNTNFDTRTYHIYQFRWQFYSRPLKSGSAQVIVEHRRFVYTQFCHPLFDQTGRSNPCILIRNKIKRLKQHSDDKFESIDNALASKLRLKFMESSQMYKSFTNHLVIRGRLQSDMQGQ